MTQTPEMSMITIARASGEAEIAAPLDLGERVRTLRKAQGWTLERAARQAGLARSTLSKIENGQMSPTYDALKKLAVGLEISVPQLFTPPEEDHSGGRLDVTKSGEGEAHMTATYEHELLAEAFARKKMLPYRARVRARSMDDFNGWVRHGGEEFLYILTGVVMLYTEHNEPVEMRRGDSAYYDGTMGHNVISTSAEDATLIWVTSLG